MDPESENEAAVSAPARQGQVGTRPESKNKPVTDRDELMATGPETATPIGDMIDSIRPGSTDEIVVSLKNNPSTTTPPIPAVAAGVR
jgi:hypothetical protein